MEKFAELKQFIDSLESDFFKFYNKKNSAAGTRLRLSMQELKNKANDFRKEIQALKKAKQS